MTQPTLFPSTDPAPSPVALDWTSAYFEPPDVEQAHKAWGATCGPCALAALLGVPVNDVRRHFPLVTRDRTWVNPTQMQAALRSAGRPFRIAKGWTPAAMVLVQFTGPWTDYSENARWAYRHTHWVALRCEPGGAAWVYDVNAGYWVSEADWQQHIVTELVRRTPRATGFECRLRLAVELAQQDERAS